MGTPLATRTELEPAPGRGGFRRGANDTPYVSDPTGATVKDGSRPRWVAYGSPSNAGGIIENTHNLSKWGERRLALGIGRDPALVALCADLVGLDPESDEFRTAADGVIVAAKEAAEAGLAADRGTHAHALSEDHDTDRDPITRAEAGELLGLPRDVQAALVEAWHLMRQREGLEVLEIEATCVHDGWRLAGTLDRIVRLTRDLSFVMATGEVVTITAGTILVLDIKSGKLTTDDAGYPRYWRRYGIQIAAYAGSVPYDTDSNTRGVWPWPIDQRWALIAHLDVQAALDGTPTCNLILVDIGTAAHYGANTVLEAKAWAARTDLFSVARVAGDLAATSTGDLIVARPQIAVPAARSARPAAEALSPASAAKSAPPELAASALGAAPVVHPSPPEPVAEPPVTAPAEPSPPPAPNPGGRWHGVEVIAVRPAEPSLEQRHIRHYQNCNCLADAAECCDPVCDCHTPPAEPSLATLHAMLGRNPDEGHPVAGGDFDTLAKAYAALEPSARSWFKQIAVDARRAGVDIYANDHRTRRRYELYRGLIALAAAGLDDDELVRNLVALALNNNAPLFPSITVGHAVGSLNASRAATFAECCIDVADGRSGLTHDDDGRPRIAPATPAA